MKTRMQAIDHLWSKLPRVVRDLSSSVGKQIRLAMVGRETELDRSLLEAVKDPLTHLVRNAVDHGIEGPAARKAAGKPVEGVLTLRAYHEGGHVIVEVADDGKGMDPDRIAEVAVQRGVITRDQVAHMSRREILNLVFRPGFSTAEKVTNVSGRGVGMDVVKTNIERIGGAVDVDSTLGVGTTWRLRIPVDAGHHPGPYRRVRHRAVRDPAGRRARAAVLRCPTPIREGSLRLTALCTDNYGCDCFLPHPHPPCNGSCRLTSRRYGGGTAKAAGCAQTRRCGHPSTTAPARERSGAGAVRSGSGWRIP
jgi:hypothetical protein